MTQADVLKRDRRNTLRATRPLHLADLQEADEQFGEQVDQMFRDGLEDLEMISKFFSRALRHEPFHYGEESRRFKNAVTSWDPVDGWAEIDQLIDNLLYGRQDY